jgi:hypothetical protein
MACELLADGACSLVSNGPPLPPRYEDDFEPLTMIHIATSTNRFTLSWDTTSSYPGQIVQVLHRRKGHVGYNEPIRYVDRDDGEYISQEVLYGYQLQDVWVRIEDTERFSPWVRLSFLSAGSTLSDTGYWPEDDDAWFTDDQAWPEDGI